jgi:hypothetical protein
MPDQLYRGTKNVDHDRGAETIPNTDLRNVDEHGIRNETLSDQLIPQT